MKKIILMLIIMILISTAAHASFLGNYKDGETVTYTVVCLTNQGFADTGCGTSDDDILDPDDTTAKSPTSALAEVSDANFPGLWRGSYDIPAASTLGTWSIFIELTNSNSTTAATVLHFSVSDSSLNDMDDNFSSIVTYTDSVETNQATLAAQITQNTSAIMTNASIERAGIMTYLVDTIYDYLSNTIYSYLVGTVNENINQTPPRVWNDSWVKQGDRKVNETSTVTANVSIDYDALWTWDHTGYIDPSGNKLNINQTISRIAMYTEEGGY